MAIEMVKIRALIEMGNVSAGTPPLGYDNHILSFNVDKARGQISTFSASIKMKRTDISGGLVNNAEVKIYAGEGSPSNLIFTGVIRTATVSPNRDDPEFVILNISGNDKLSYLTGKKYTRRCRSTKGVWVSIDSVSRAGLKSGKLTYEPDQENIDVWSGDIYNKDDVVTTRPALRPDSYERVKDSKTSQEVSMSVRFLESTEE
jgi:hypothetical protein